MPIPPALDAYVRDEAQWALIIRRAVLAFAGAGHKRTGERFFRALVYGGPDCDLIGRYILHLFPPVRCAGPGCEGRFIPHTDKLRHCSDDCRRRAAGRSAA